MSPQEFNDRAQQAVGGSMIIPMLLALLIGLVSFFNTWSCRCFRAISRTRAE